MTKEKIKFADERIWGGYTIGNGVRTSFKAYTNPKTTDVTINFVQTKQSEEPIVSVQLGKLELEISNKTIELLKKLTDSLEKELELRNSNQDSV